MQALVLRGGDVIDGRGGQRYAADVVIDGGRIVGLLTPGTPCAAEALDVTGLAVAPGFIDMHAHSDLAVLADPDHLAKVAQGVTLEVVGQDGLGYAPVTDEAMTAMRSQLAGWNGEPELDYSWRSVADYLARLDEGSPVNVATLVPHGTVRMAVMGTDPRPATEGELARIRRIVADGMRDGAMGMSSGLTYPPGMYASDDELVDALAPVREAGGYYCPHHRNYGSRVVEAYRDCLEVAGRAGVPLHLAHCHINFPQNRGRAGEVLAAIDEALEAGQDVTLDSYPYLAGATYLASLLPGWTHAGGTAATLAHLQARESRSRLLHEIEVAGSDGHHGIPMDWATIAIASSKRNPWAVGRTVAELAAERGVEPGDLFCDLLVADELSTGCLVNVGNEENVRAVIRHRAHTVGTDGILVGERPHPRGWGSFPRLLGTYARELGLLTMEEVVEHATSRAARRLGLRDRGVLAPGYWADVVVFDPETVASPATYERPTLPPVGISHVFVNGEAVLRDGRRTGALPGRAVRRGD